MGNIEPGRVFGERYRVVGMLGEGGMAVVVEAEDLREASPVALKVLAADASPALRARFLREARTTSKVSSPHVVRVLGVGEEPTGEAFLVMERLVGEDLAARLEREGPLPVSTACAFARDAARGLAAAHEVGVVHRDIKPSNLFVHREGGEEVLKVVDFGVSREVLGRTVEGDPLTATGAVLGTPHYLSPEQLVSSRRVDPQTDVWSLGVTLFELLTGAPPFASDRIDELFRAILSAEPPELRRSRPDVPEPLAALVRRCLAKEPSLRPSSAERFAAAISPFAEARPTSARVERSDQAAEEYVSGPTELAEHVTTEKSAVHMPARPPIEESRSEQTAEVPSPGGAPPRRWVWGLATLLLMGASAGATWMWMPRPERVRERKERAPAPPPEASPRPALTGLDSSLLEAGATRIERCLWEGRDDEAMSRSLSLAQQWAHKRDGTPAESVAMVRIGMMDLVLRARFTRYLVDRPLDPAQEGQVLQEIRHEVTLTGALMKRYLARLPADLDACRYAYDVLRYRAFHTNAKARVDRWSLESQWKKRWLQVAMSTASLSRTARGNLARAPTPLEACVRIRQDVLSLPELALK